MFYINITYIYVSHIPDNITVFPLTKYSLMTFPTKLGCMYHSIPACHVINSTKSYTSFGKRISYLGSCRDMDYQLHNFPHSREQGDNQLLFACFAHGNRIGGSVNCCLIAAIHSHRQLHIKP